ncbi:MAG: excinuclease ABC subunit UvrA [Myxococcales bacterium]|nr:excinuclease ABC subunit UvrA [Myxococcales bacterium]
MDKIIIKGAREHNLKNIDVELPRNKLVVITGLSGSGKSSLAFDTIYAEGQRRYVESLSTYARQFLEQMGKPDLDSIEGLSPAISIEQKSTSKNPRSTVGTVTEIYDYLRLLYARIGTVHCHSCGRPISSQTVQQMVDRVLRLPDGTRFSVLAPVVRDRKGEFKKEIDALRRQGLRRVNIDGELFDLSEDTIKIDKNKSHTIEVYIDRLVVKPDVRQRLTESIELGLQLAEGIVKVSPVLLGGDDEAILSDGAGITDENGDIIFSERFACVACGISYPEISPRLFSFNNPSGACPACDGIGAKMFFDPELIVPTQDLSLREGAIEPWEKRNGPFFQQILEAIAGHYSIDMVTPWYELPQAHRDIILYGSKGEEIEFWFEKNGRRHTYKKEFEGVIQNLERRLSEYERRRREEGTAAQGSDSFEAAYEEFSPYMNKSPCEECQGTRLRKEARFVKVGGLPINELTAKPIRDAKRFFDSLKLSPRQMEIADRILKEVRDRLGFLVNVGLDYLTLDRTAATLSGGEAQRIRLASQIGSSLTGVLYVLDEPSIGLHQRDNQRLLETLFRLRDIGNTVIVVEHDEDTIRAADHVLDMGPRAGVLGGRIVAAGTPADIMSSTGSLTGAYLSGRKKIEVRGSRRQCQNRYIVLKNCKEHNLRDITVRFPVGVFTCVTGVSGSGKSTLVIDTLLGALKQKLHHSKCPVGSYESIEGIHHVDRVIDIDQLPIGRTPRSNPATYTGVFTHIRDLFAALPDSKARGYKAGRYSFNVKGGRCEACQGDGILRIEMHFLPDVYVVCEECSGRRYNRETLEVKYKGASIADVLDMTVSQACEFLGHIPKIRQKLETLRDVGLGYIALGQAATTLSGGEAQRIKLSKELAKKGSGRTVYILDEPTTGLHFDDIKQLLDVLGRLVDSGNTVIVIEHNLDVIKTADYIVDMGPEGGDGGGYVVGCGTPEDIARVPGSYTGQYLKRVLAVS